MGVVDSGSIGEAARRLNITQPGLTQSIRKIEDSYGVALLHRSALGVTPTVEGRLIYDHAIGILTGFERLRDDMLAAKGIMPDRLRLGVAADFIDRMLPDALGDLLVQHPRVDVEVIEGFYEDLIARLLRGGLDAAISLFPAGEAPADVTRLPIWTFRSALVVRRAHPLAERTGLSLDDLVVHRWMVQGQPTMRRLLESVFATRGFAPPPDIMRTNSLHLVLRAVKRFDLVAYVPLSVVADDLATGELVRLDCDAPEISVDGGFILNRRLTPTPLLKTLIATMERLQP